MDDVDGLLEEMSSWLTEEEESLDKSVRLRPHMLRLMVHLALFFRRIGRTSSEDLIGMILEAYVQQLLQLTKTDLAAVYVSQLPLADDQVALYAQCLVVVDQRMLHSAGDVEDNRADLLSLAHKVGLDVKAIAKRVVRTLCQQQRSEEVECAKDVSLQVTTRAEDEHRIRSLGWLLIDPSMRSDLLVEANYLMRGFLLRRQIEAVKATFNAVPMDTVSLLSEQWESRTGLTELPDDLQSAVREYICVKTYLDALDAFQEWFTRFHHSKPKKSAVQQQQQQQQQQRDMSRHSTQLSFTDNLLKEQQNKQHQAELQRWKAAVESLTKSSIDKLYNVLLFPDGGWMSDPLEGDETRQHQLQLLRQTCVPHAALLLSNVLSSTQQFAQCLELANVIASQEQALYKVCSAEQLSQLIKQIRQAYIQVLDLGVSP